MALEEKRNNVKYQGRDDYSVVYYDVLETGKKYFFLKKLKNGNVIATTNLKIAINANKPEELADIGVVNSDGQEIIPFTNKRIRDLNEDILLAEPVAPVSENVTKAIEDRSNPQEATRLVSAANTIKAKLNNSMGAEGKFVFNDLFSEATIYDIDGNNLVNGEYYSFVGMNDNSLFLSKNDPEAEIVSLPFKEEAKEETVVAEEPVENAVEVSAVSVDQNAVEEAFNNEQAAVSAQEVVNAEETPVGETVVEEPTQEEVVSEEQPATENVEEVQAEEVVPEALTEENVVEEPTQEEVISEEQPATEDVEATQVEANVVPEALAEDVVVPIAEEAVTSETPVEETVVEEPVQEEAVAENINEEVTDEQEIENTEAIQEVVADEITPVEDEKEEEVDLNLNITPDEEETDIDDYRLEDSQIKVDTIDRDDSFDNFVEESQFRESGISEGTEIVEQMISKIKDQDNRIDRLENQLSEQRDINRSVVRKTKELEDKILTLNKENNDLEEKGNYYKRVAVTLAD